MGNTLHLFDKVKWYVKSVFYINIHNRKMGELNRHKIPRKNNSLDVFINMREFLNKSAKSILKYNVTFFYKVIGY